MSTRATIHFEDANGEVRAIIYRHGDGYPKGLGVDLQTFFGDVQNQTKDTRFNDPSYLAAKWVVWDAQQAQKLLLDFLSVGVVQQDPDDIEYRYRVICKDDKRPAVKCESVR